MLVNISEHKGVLDAMLGTKEAVTDHSTVQVLTFMDYQHDKIDYQNRLHEIINKK